MVVRRVKCDEEKPSCQRCILTGRKCDGYTIRSQEPSYTGPVSSYTADPKPSDLMSLIKAPPSAISGNVREARSFHFFCRETAPQLAGFFGDELWDCLILRATHHEPAIRHAVIALGSLHERFVAHDGFVTKSKPEQYRDDFALQEYTIAIRTLVQPLMNRQEQAVDVCLLACVLFACFECMQSRYGPAIAHINSGARILMEIERDAQTKKRSHATLEISTIPHVPFEIIEGLFMRLKLQVMEMVGGDLGWIPSDVCSSSDQSETFSSVAEARQSLVWNWHYTIYVASLITPNSQTRQEWRSQTLLRLSEWNAKFEIFLESHGSNITEMEMKGVKVLQIYRILAWTTLSVKSTIKLDVTIWDEFTPAFDRMIDLAAEVVGLNEQNSVPAAVFSLDIGIISALYWVISRCRHPDTRRKAIAALKHGTRQEGIWNSFLTAMVAERVVQMEECGCGDIRVAADVPDWSRISDVNPVFDPVARKACLTYTRGETEHDLVRKVVQEVIEW